jgi:hypothetical protein
MVVDGDQWNGADVELLPAFVAERYAFQFNGQTLHTTRIVRKMWLATIALKYAANNVPVGEPRAELVLGGTEAEARDNAARLVWDQAMKHGCSVYVDVVPQWGGGTK